MSKLCAGRIHTKRSPSLGELGLRELRRQDSRSAQRDASLAKNVDLEAREDAAVENEKKPETGFVSCGGRIRARPKGTLRLRRTSTWEHVRMLP